jgi:hypothetical protein
MYPTHTAITMTPMMLAIQAGVNRSERIAVGR